jgi:hypothetical protein
VKKILHKLKIFFVKLLFPLWLFPFKLLIYPFYFFILFWVKLFLAAIGLMIDAFIFPFRSLKHFLKAIIYFLLIVYLFFSFLVIVDYIDRENIAFTKMFCMTGAEDKLKKSVVRVVGGYSEGSGFFIERNRVLTNFHVIADEPSPKIILPDGNFVTPYKIVGDKNADLAVLYISELYPEMVFELPDTIRFYDEEPVIAAGYPLGTGLAGKATIMKGNFADFRYSKKDPVSYIQTNISLVKGMSGGPLTDQCGSLVGINTQSLAGLSLFIFATDVNRLIPSFTDEGIEKIEVDPSLSPEDAVKAFYTYLKARRMEGGYNLLSRDYRTRTDFEEWTGRFTDILDVDIVKTERFENTDDTAFVKFTTKNWVDGETEEHFYEGTWQTVFEEGVYKMNRSKIIEVENPGWEWYYK